jgi:hypothetical protein
MSEWTRRSPRRREEFKQWALPNGSCGVPPTNDARTKWMKNYEGRIRLKCCWAAHKTVRPLESPSFDRRGMDAPIVEARIAGRNENLTRFDTAGF